MKINFRKTLFWIVDFIKGRKKIDNYNDIKNIIENYNTKEVKAKKAQYLEDILNHAINSTPFYKSNKNFKNILDFPVINKNIIKNNYSNFESNLYKDKPRREVKTSGSTGTPFKVSQDSRKITRNSADNIYFSEKVNYNIGNKLYYFRIWNVFENKNFIVKFAQNIIPINVFDINDNYIKDFILKLKKDKSVKSWIGYASSFKDICKYLDKNNEEPINCNLQSVIAISESLSSYTKESIKKYFGANVVSRYSNVENGILAQQLINTSYFIINHASYYIEILHYDKNIPVKNGEKGRIVVTDLFNYCMPMIRYDTGDVGSIDTVDGKLVLVKVEGRKIDLITNTKGEIVSSKLISLINKYPELNQCQLIQKTFNKYLFKINIHGDFKNETKFINEFKEYLGNDANIVIEYVEEIPLLNSGKRRAMINETSYINN